MQGVKQIFGSDEKKELVDPYFVFSFAGQSVSNIIYSGLCDLGPLHFMTSLF